MRILNRNKVTFYYALYEGRASIKDEWGNETGEYKTQYSKPQTYKANVSSAKGEISTRQFGETETYDKVITMDIDAPDIDEYSILWVDSMPVLDEDGNTTTPHDYIVRKVAKSLNVITLAINKVTVNA